MPKSLLVHARSLTSKEREILNRWAQSPIHNRVTTRAKAILLSDQGKASHEIAKQLGVSSFAVRTWLHRFNDNGLRALIDKPSKRRPQKYDSEQVRILISTALTDPVELGLGFQAWTTERLSVYLNEAKGIGVKRSRIREIIHEHGLFRSKGCPNWQHGGVQYHRRRCDPIRTNLINTFQEDLNSGDS